MKRYISGSIMFIIVLLIGIVMYNLLLGKKHAEENANEYKSQMQQVMDETCYDKHQQLKKVKENHDDLLSIIKQKYIDKGIAQYEEKWGTGSNDSVSSIYIDIQNKEQDVASLESASRQIRQDIANCVN